MNKTFAQKNRLWLLLGIFPAFFLFSCGVKTEIKENTASSSDFDAILTAYRSYTIEEIDLFVKGTEAFTAAVKAGKAEEAKKLYAPVRMHYERIEPIAEALGDLDPRIDAREGDVPEEEWQGFHRLEKALWQDKNLAGTGDYADKLLEDAQLLRAKVETVDVEIGLLLTGAVELLNEVSASKVTGEEERYSHTDLYDFVANVQGARKIFDLLKPRLEANDKALSDSLEAYFAKLEGDLDRYRNGDSYVDYTSLSQAETKSLSLAVDALAEPLSKMGQALSL